MPVVRVDDEVWEWLKSLAQPLEDTPNSVMRRVAGIDPPVNRGNLVRRAPAAAPSAPASARLREATEREDETPSRASEPTTKRVTGEWLNRAFHLDARHALYHKDGTFYERLARFPGVLCDKGGYVRYEDEQEFLTDASLSVGEKVNVPRSLQEHPRYRRFQPAARG